MRQARLHKTLHVCGKVKSHFSWVTRLYLIRCTQNVLPVSSSTDNLTRSHNTGLMIDIIGRSSSSPSIMMVIRLFGLSTLSTSTTRGDLGTHYRSGSPLLIIRHYCILLAEMLKISPPQQLLCTRKSGCAALTQAVNAKAELSVQKLTVGWCSYPQSLLVCLTDSGIKDRAIIHTIRVILPLLRKAHCQWCIPTLIVGLIVCSGP